MLHDFLHGIIKKTSAKGFFTLSRGKIGYLLTNRGIQPISNNKKIGQSSNKNRC
jgi:hypothetical protein